MVAGCMMENARLAHSFRRLTVEKFYENIAVLYYACRVAPVYRSMCFSL